MSINLHFNPSFQSVRTAFNGSPRRRSAPRDYPRIVDSKPGEGLTGARRTSDGERQISTAAL
jgi:hypothetical protein